VYPQAVKVAKKLSHKLSDSLKKLLAKKDK